jgi:transcriptional regulator with AAA-type ATPase domain
VDFPHHKPLKGEEGDAMRKTELLAFLQNQTDFFDPDNLSEVFTASYLARRFAMQRNTASHYLNQLVAQDVLVKINTRPVYFLHKAAFCQQFFPFPAASTPAWRSCSRRATGSRNRRIIFHC